MRNRFPAILILLSAILLLPLRLTAGDILIYGPTLAPSNLGFTTTEKTIAESEGHTVTVSNSGPGSIDWNALTTQDFASFDAIVFADRGCADQPIVGPEVFNAAVANRTVWSAAIQGNIVILGNSPIDRVHASGGSLVEAEQLVRNALNFAASGNGTGLYISLSCYYFFFTSEQQVDVLAGLGNFAVMSGGQPAPSCPNTVTIVEPGHPVMAGLTDAGLSNWNCSMREWFTAFPSSFGPLASESGHPYILAGGAQRNPVLLDPVPDLLAGPAVTTVPDTLATLGREVEGVAADGVARVVVRIPASQANEPFMLTLLNDSNNTSVSVDEDGGLTTPGQDRSAAANMLFVSAVDTSAGPMAFAAYHAPIDFPRPAGRDDAVGQKSVKIRVQSLDSGGATKEVTVKIVRPLVLLVHGIWSNPTAWDQFTPLILDNRFFVRRADYEASNALGFVRNALVLLDDPKVPAIMNEFRTTKAVAAIQFDAVAHSMGGDVMRAMIVVGMVSGTRTSCAVTCTNSSHSAHPILERPWRTDYGTVVPLARANSPSAALVLTRAYSNSKRTVRLSTTSRRNLSSRSQRMPWSAEPANNRPTP